MYEISAQEELQKLGFTFVDRTDRRLEGLTCFTELQKEKFFIPLEYKGYIFLFLLESEKEQQKLLDIVNTALPFIARTRALDIEYIEKKGFDISNSCHTVTEQMASEIGKGERVMVKVTDKSSLSVRGFHSLIRLQMPNGEPMTIDPTQPVRGQHDPRKKETYQLRESIISPLIMVGSDTFMQRRFTEIYHVEQNPFGQETLKARLQRSFLGKALQMASP